MKKLLILASVLAAFALSANAADTNSTAPSAKSSAGC